MQMRWSRREALASGTAAALVATLPAAVRAAAAQPASRDAALRALLARHYEEYLTLRPEEASYLGVDTGERAGLRARLSDLSDAGIAAFRAQQGRHLRELQQFGEAGLGDEARLEREVAIYRIEIEKGFEPFPYHSDVMGGGSPYGPTQMFGTYSLAPRLLSDLHPIENRADADAYIARLEQVSAAIDAETAQVRRNAVAGVIAPRFILERTLGMVEAVRDSDPAQTVMVRSISQRAGAKGLTGYDERARRLFEESVQPALARQAEAMRALLSRASEGAGVGRLPDGAAYYAAALKYHSTSRLTADEVHRIGLEQVAELNAGIDRILRGQGLSEGSVKERVVAFARAPDQAFPDTDAGRAAIIAFANERLERVRERLPRLFGRLPRSGYEVRRFPPEIEAGMPIAQALTASADGSRPGVFYINLRDTADFPRFTLPTLTYHEAAPGHLFEGALTQEAGELPLYRKGWFFTAYGEGWGLYAEQLADELGMYEDDPTGRVGYLMSYLFRAARLVVDTGLHTRVWSREQATEYLYENSLNTRASALTEVERYLVMPGQATAYKIGHAAFAGLRAEAAGRPGFDVRAFHDFLLAGGNLPLDVLERRVRARFGS